MHGVDFSIIIRTWTMLRLYTTSFFRHIFKSPFLFLFDCFTSRLPVTFFFLLRFLFDFIPRTSCTISYISSPSLLLLLLSWIFLFSEADGNFVFRVLQIPSNVLLMSLINLCLIFFSSWLSEIIFFDVVGILSETVRFRITFLVCSICSLFWRLLGSGSTL